MKPEIWLGIAAVLSMSVIIILIFFMSLNNLEIRNTQTEYQMINATLDPINMNIQTPLENIKITAKAPAPQTTFPYYRAYYANGDVVEKYFGDLNQVRDNLTTKEMAPIIAREVMKPYGGIPNDAYVSLSVINGGMIGANTPKQRILQNNNEVYFSRTINGVPLTGMDDGIIVWLGDNGDLLGYKKFWRTLEQIGSVPVVPVDKAIQKLGNREMVNPPQNPSDAVVTSINLRYYATSWNAKEIYLEPVYEFYSTLSNGHDYQFYVYARQFASFNLIPVVSTKMISGKSVHVENPFTVKFMDTSDAHPTKWLWDFGDGTTSTDQNPTHTYKSAGTYNVTLTVWNDLGSDSITRQYTVSGASTVMTEANSTEIISDTAATPHETFTSTMKIIENTTVLTTIYPTDSVILPSTGSVNNVSPTQMTFNDTATVTATNLTMSTTISTVSVAASSTESMNKTQNEEFRNSTSN